MGGAIITRRGGTQSGSYVYEKKKVKPYLTFLGNYDFTMSITKQWDGKIEYSYDTHDWTEWDGSSISSKFLKLHLRGSGNTVISEKQDPFKFDCEERLLNSFRVECDGSIEALLDYGLAIRGEHPSMGRDCFANLFFATPLVKAPELTATELSVGCYAHMFSDSELMVAPELPATNLTESCYEGMFFRTKIQTPPRLPAMTLPPRCYYLMFAESKLETLPDIPATVLGKECCVNMFAGCASIKVFETEDKDHQLIYMIPTLGQKVLSEETDAFITIFRGTSSEIESISSETRYYVPGTAGEHFLKLYSTSGLGLKVRLDLSNVDGTIEASLDAEEPNATWAVWDGTEITGKNEEFAVYLRGTGVTKFVANLKIAPMSNSVNGTFTYACDGNIETLLDYRLVADGKHPHMNEGCFAHLFEKTPLVKAPELPAMELSDWCYDNMFANTLLSIPPELPATKLAVSCYRRMFYGCDMLSALPALRAPILEKGCYEEMFSGCSKIWLCETGDGDWPTEDGMMWPTIKYRIPFGEVIGEDRSGVGGMFADTLGVMAGAMGSDTPKINRTYYTQNNIVGAPEATYIANNKTEMVDKNGYLYKKIIG